MAKTAGPSARIDTRSAVQTEIDPNIYRRRYLILGSLCLCLVLVVATVSSVNVAIPTLAANLKPTDTQVLWIVDAYAIVFAGLLLFSGALGDRFGRKGALLTGLVIFAGASILCSQSTSPTVLIGYRAIMGIGAALIMPATLSLLTSVFPRAERPKAIAIWAGFAGAGGAIGPVMGGVLIEHFWYGSVFFVAVPIAAITFVMIALLAPTSKESVATKLDPVGALFSMVGFSALLLAIIEGPEKGWTAPLVLISFAVAAAGLIGFVLWERSVASPMLDMNFFRQRRFAMGSLGVTFTFLAMFSLFFILTQYLQYVRGYGPLKAGCAGLPFAFTMIAVSPRATNIAAGIGLRNTVVAGEALMGVGLLIMSFSGLTTPYVVVALALVVMAFGVAIAMPSLTSGILSSVPMNKAGVGSAVNDTTREVGGAIGIAVVGSVVSSIYRSHLKPTLARLASQGPDGAAAASQARKSVGRTNAVAKALEAGPGGRVASVQFLDEVHHAFVDGLRVGLWVAAAVVFVSAFVLALRHPAHADAAPVGGH